MKPTTIGAIILAIWAVRVLAEPIDLGSVPGLKAVEGGYIGTQVRQPFPIEFSHGDILDVTLTMRESGMSEGFYIGNQTTPVPIPIYRDMMLSTTERWNYGKTRCVRLMRWHDLVSASVGNTGIGSATIEGATIGWRAYAGKETGMHLLKSASYIPAPVPTATPTIEPIPEPTPAPTNAAAPVIKFGSGTFYISVFDARTGAGVEATIHLPKEDE